MLKKTILALMLIVGVVIPATAQQSVVSNTAYEAWVLGCSAQTDKADKAKTVKACEIRTSVVVKDEKSGQQGVAAVVALGRLLPDQKLKMMAQLPIHAVLNVPVKVAGKDDKTIIELAFIACQQQMCTASADLTDAQIASLKKTGEAFFVTWRSQTGQDVKVEVSTKGLTAALDALVREK